MLKARQQGVGAIRMSASAPRRRTSLVPVGCSQRGTLHTSTRVMKIFTPPQNSAPQKPTHKLKVASKVCWWRNDEGSGGKPKSFQHSPEEDEDGEPMGSWRLLSPHLSATFAKRR